MDDTTTRKHDDMICKYCKCRKEFEPTHYNQRYCNSSCRTKEQTLLKEVGRYYFNAVFHDGADPQALFERIAENHGSYINNS
jgi:hypothetical protein